MILEGDQTCDGYDVSDLLESSVKCNDLSIHKTFTTGIQKLSFTF